MIKVEDRQELEAINKRTSRFRALAHMQNDCEAMGKAMGLIDPDGVMWVIGDSSADVKFEKCYISSVIE